MTSNSGEGILHYNGVFRVSVPVLAGLTKTIVSVRWVLNNERYYLILQVNIGPA